MKYPFIRPRYYHSLFQDVVGFIKKPVIKKNLNKTTKFKIYDTVGLFILKIFFLIPTSVLVGFIHDPENLTKSSMAERFSPLILLLVAVIILPVIEEVCFRLSLKFKPIYLALTLGVFLYYFLSKVIFATKVSAIDDNFVIRFFSSITLVILMFPILSIVSVKEKLSKLWNDNFQAIYYISCLSFAWIHIFNYELNMKNLLFLPLITLPQLMSAIISGYTRVAFGFKYPLLFHMFTNLVAVSLSFLPFAD